MTELEPPRRLGWIRLRALLIRWQLRRVRTPDDLLPHFRD